jgi:hypothetical protein
MSTTTEPGTKTSTSSILSTDSEKARCYSATERHTVTKKNGTKKKSKPKAGARNGSKMKPTTNAPSKRKIGERTEVITEQLTLTQREAERSRVCELISERDRIVDQKKAVTSKYTAEINAVDAQIRACMKAASSGRRDVEITVEEWLTDQNQIQRYRTDTGELIGDRTATPHELQEELPFEDPEEDGEENEDDDGATDVDGDAHVEEAIAAERQEAGVDEEFGEAS